LGGKSFYDIYFQEHLVYGSFDSIKEPIADIENLLDNILKD